MPSCLQAPSTTIPRNAPPANASSACATAPDAEPVSTLSAAGNTLFAAAVACCAAAAAFSAAEVAEEAASFADVVAFSAA